MKDKINNLYNANDKSAYETLLELEHITENSNKLYNYFDELLDMLKNDKSFTRVRGFRLICSLAKWDVNNKINDNIDTILSELDDEKGTSVRQCLEKINLIMTYKVELKDTVEKKLKHINLIKYNESMQTLIKKDIEKILI